MVVLGNRRLPMRGSRYGADPRCDFADSRWLWLLTPRRATVDTSTVGPMMKTVSVLADAGACGILTPRTVLAADVDVIPPMITIPGAEHPQRVDDRGSLHAFLAAPPQAGYRTRLVYHSSNAVSPNLPTHPRTLRSRETRFSLSLDEPLYPGEQVRITANDQMDGAPLEGPFVWEFRSQIGRGNRVFLVRALCFPRGVYASDVALGDIDADGDLDVVLGGTDHSAVWRTKVGACLRAIRKRSTSFLFRPHGSATWDGDGDLDLVTDSGNAPGTIGLNDGSGNFIKQTVAIRSRGEIDWAIWTAMVTSTWSRLTVLGGFKLGSTMAWEAWKPEGRTLDILAVSTSRWAIWTWTVIWTSSPHTPTAVWRNDGTGVVLESGFSFGTASVAWPSVMWTAMATWMRFLSAIMMVFTPSGSIGATADSCKADNASVIETESASSWEIWTAMATWMLSWAPAEEASAVARCGSMAEGEFFNASIKSYNPLRPMRSHLGPRR